MHLCAGKLRSHSRSADGLHRELMDLNPSAARSLGEGLEETLACPAATAVDASQHQRIESALAIERGRIGRDSQLGTFSRLRRGLVWDLSKRRYRFPL
jgi:hypothetical protein